MRGLFVGSLAVVSSQVLAPAPYTSYTPLPFAPVGTPLTAPYATASFTTAPLATSFTSAPVVAAAPYVATAYGAPVVTAAPLAAAPYGAPYGAPLAAAPYGYGASQDRSFIFDNPALDLVAVSALAGSGGSNSLLPILALTGGLNGNGNGGGLFGGGSYDQYGNYQDPAKKAILLTGLASGSVSPLTAIALDRNPGATTTDTLVASALGNNPLTSLLVLNQAPGQSLTGGSNLFGNSYGNGFGGGGGIFGNGNNGVLPALLLAGSIGGNKNGGGLTTLLALNALSNNNNNGYNNGYYNGGYTNGGYVNGAYTNGGYVNGGYSNGGFFNNGGSVLNRVNNNLNNLFDRF